VAAADEAWNDVTKLMQDRRTRAVGEQLCRAIGSISANIAEGYSRSSGRERAHFYEYALGSARESREWYYQGRHVLGDLTTSARMTALSSIIRLLTVGLSHERPRKLT